MPTPDYVQTRRVHNVLTGSWRNDGVRYSVPRETMGRVDEVPYAGHDTLSRSPRGGPLFHRHRTSCREAAARCADASVARNLARESASTWALNAKDGRMTTMTSVLRRTPGAGRFARSSEGERMLGSGRCSPRCCAIWRSPQVDLASLAPAPMQGMSPGHARRLKELEVENGRLKKLLAEAELDKAMLKELAEGKW